MSYKVFNPYEDFMPKVTTELVVSSVESITEVITSTAAPQVTLEAMGLKSLGTETRWSQYTNFEYFFIKSIKFIC